MYFNYHDMFNTKHPGFFEKESIRILPPENIYEEQLMDLHTYDPDAVEVPCPANITFGVYEGDFEELQRTVLEIDDSWDGIFQPDTPVYAAYDGDKLVGLCILEDFGTYEGYKIGGPGCIGVLDEYRRQGIGLKLVQKSSGVLKERGYDLGYIHYTSFAKLFSRVGYKSVLWWNHKGIVK